MPKRQAPPEVSEPSKLRRPLGEAEAILDKQIERGEAILNGLRPGALPPEARRWHDENAAILERLFTGPEGTEYDSCILVTGLSVAMSDYDEDETSWHRDRLEWLRSLRGRLSRAALLDAVREARAPSTLVANGGYAGLCPDPVRGGVCSL